MIHENLTNYYATNFSLKGEGYDISELDNMIPFERKLYTQMMINKIQRIEQELKTI